MVLKYTTDKQTFHVIEAVGLIVETFGDPDNASYEWRVKILDGAVVQQSNTGYGILAVALRDGLSWALKDFD